MTNRIPAITVSWQADPRGAERLRVRVMGHAEMAPDTAWELWMLPGADQKPVSLGLITTHENQTVVLPRPLAVADQSRVRPGDERGAQGWVANGTADRTNPLQGIVHDDVGACAVYLVAWHYRSM